VGLRAGATITVAGVGAGVGTSAAGQNYPAIRGPRRSTCSSKLPRRRSQGGPWSRIPERASRLTPRATPSAAGNQGPPIWTRFRTIRTISRPDLQALAGPAAGAGRRVDFHRRISAGGQLPLEGVDSRDPDQCKSILAGVRQARLRPQSKSSPRPGTDKIFTAPGTSTSATVSGNSRNPYAPAEGRRSSSRNMGGGA